MGRAATLPTVLLVEDERLISRLVADWLNDRGFAVHEAASGDEAFDFIDHGGPLDVMFTDLNLPGSMNGAELAERVRAAAGLADCLCLWVCQRGRHLRWCRARCSCRSLTTRPTSARCSSG